MPINVTGPGKLRVSAHAQQFGVRMNIGSANNPSSLFLTRTQSTFGTDPTRPVVIFDDEEVLLQGTYRTSSKVGVRPGQSNRVRAVVEVAIGSSAWSEATAMSQGPSDVGISLAARFRLQPGVTAFRVRATEGIGKFGKSYESFPRQVQVKRAPAILAFIAMGGSGSGGSSGTGSGSSSSSGSSTSSGSTSGNGILVNPSRCGVDPTLIPELLTDGARNRALRD